MTTKCSVQMSEATNGLSASSAAAGSPWIDSSRSAPSRPIIGIDRQADTHRDSRAGAIPMIEASGCDGQQGRIKGVAHGPRPMAANQGRQILQFFLKENRILKKITNENRRQNLSFPESIAISNFVVL